VFAGVLFTAYLMMNGNTNSRLPLQSLQSPSYRTEAAVVDPAVQQLLQMEQELARLKKEKHEQEEQKRLPSDIFR
jgi:hypothetical protein